VAAITITDYDPKYQNGIDKMMEGITKEYSEPITSSHSTKIYEAYKLPNQKYWVALHEGQVVGTAGMVLFSPGNGVLKRMMVDKEFRGGNYSTAQLLLNKSMGWAKENSAHTIYLGTMDQFKAAQNFYQKNGFKEIALNQLPKDMPVNPMDSIHYFKMY
jgi:N-acetylglutamate synthase-like GNAT family acetyltransferase